MRLFVFGFLLIAVLSACRSGKEEAQLLEPPSLEAIASPAIGNTGEPNLFVDADGRVYLSWVKTWATDSAALEFAVLDSDHQWSEPRRIASGNNWFVNWADFPSVAVYPETNIMAAHWLAKEPGGDTFDYRILVSQSTDRGNRWSSPFVLHSDGIPAEHGFVSMLPLNSGRMLGIWLDGRQTKTGKHAGPDAHGHGHGGGAMTLRSAEFDTSGQLYEEQELDDRICDCCQTDLALSSRGPVAVYRDRSAEEIRDIYFTRREEGIWSKPRPVFADQWKIAGCPVNGPAIDAAGENVVVAWYTGAGDSARVQVIFSSDAGDSFGKPVRIDGGNPSGRVDVVLLAPDLALVSWLENLEKGAEIRLAKVSPQGMPEAAVGLVKTSESRRSGFPILARAREDFFLAWTQTDAQQGQTQVRIAKIRL